MPIRGGHPLTRDLGLVFLLGLLWGSPYALTKIALATIQPLTLVAGRVAMAAAVLWLVVFLRGSAVPATWRFIRLLIIQGIVSCVVPYTLITFGQRTVESSLAAILNSTTPLIVCLLSVLWMRQEAVTPRTLFGVAVGFAGVIGIAGASALFGLGDHVAGQAMIIVATVSSAASVMHGRRFDDVAPEVVAAGMLTAAAFILVPFAFVLETPWQSAPSAASLTALFVNAAVATGFGFVVYFQLIRRIGSVGTSSASYVKPTAGVLIGCGFLGEPMTWPLALGLLAVLIGVAAINTPVRTTPANAAPE